MRAYTGILSNKILQPTQPARRAVGARGLRRSTAERAKAKWGMRRTVRTAHVSRAECKTKRLGVRSSRMARFISEEAASTVVVPIGFDWLFRWTGRLQE